jgi:hypothetical protein
LAGRVKCWAIPSNDRACSRQYSKCRSFTSRVGARSAISRQISRRATSLDGSGNGSGSSSTPLTMEKTAVVAPMVSARVRTTVAA